MIYKTLVKIKKILIFSCFIAVLGRQVVALDNDRATAYFQTQINWLKESQNKVKPYTLMHLSSILSAEIYFYFLLLPQEDFPQDLQASLTQIQNLSLQFEKKWHKNWHVRAHTPLFERALLLAFLGEEGETLINNNATINAYSVLKTSLNISTEHLKNKLIVFLFDFATQSNFMRETLVSYQKENLNLWKNKINVSLKNTNQNDKIFKNLTTFFREKIYKAEVFYTSLNSQLRDNLFQFHELQVQTASEITGLNAFWKLYYSLPQAQELAQKALIHSVYLNLQLLVTATHIEGALEKHAGYNYFSPAYLEWAFYQKYILEKNISRELRDFHELQLETLTSEEKLLAKIKFYEIQYEAACALYHPGLAAGTIRKLLFLDPWIEFRPVDDKWLNR